MKFQFRIKLMFILYIISDYRLLPWLLFLCEHINYFDGEENRNIALKRISSIEWFEWINVLPHFLIFFYIISMVSWSVGLVDRNPFMCISSCAWVQT